jgi:hypothetical protein
VGWNISDVECRTRASVPQLKPLRSQEHNLRCASCMYPISAYYFQ